MKTLEKLIPVGLRMRKRGTEEEKEVNALIKRTLRLLHLSWNKDNRIIYVNRAGGLKSELRERLKEYNGEFSDYFTKRLEQVELEYRWALGYK